MYNVYYLSIYMYLLCSMLKCFNISLQIQCKPTLHTMEVCPGTYMYICRVSYRIFWWEGKKFVGHGQSVMHEAIQILKFWVWDYTNFLGGGKIEAGGKNSWAPVWNPDMYCTRWMPSISGRWREHIFMHMNNQSKSCWKKGKATTTNNRKTTQLARNSHFFKEKLAASGGNRTHDHQDHIILTDWWQVDTQWYK